LDLNCREQGTQTSIHGPGALIDIPDCSDDKDDRKVCDADTSFLVWYRLSMSDLEPPREVGK